MIYSSLIILIIDLKYKILTWQCLFRLTQYLHVLYITCNTNKHVHVHVILLLLPPLPLALLSTHSVGSDVPSTSTQQTNKQISFTFK